MPLSDALPRLTRTATLATALMLGMSAAHSQPAPHLSLDAPIQVAAASSSSAHDADAHQKKSGKAHASAQKKHKASKHAQRGGRSMRGKASWYGRRFAGKDTASGDDFNPRHMTAAHPSLPLGTRVRVTNLDNRKSAVLTVNDRLPRKSGRLIDVSRAAAKKLDFVDDGVTDVRVDVLHRPAKK